MMVAAPLKPGQEQPVITINSKEYRLNHPWYFMGRLIPKDLLAIRHSVEDIEHFYLSSHTLYAEFLEPDWSDWLSNEFKDELINTGTLESIFGVPIHSGGQYDVAPGMILAIGKSDTEHGNTAAIQMVDYIEPTEDR